MKNMYRIDYSNVEYKFRQYKIMILISIILCITFISFIKLVDNDLSLLVWVFFSFIFGVITFYIGITGLVKTIKRKKGLRKLANNGVLIKDMPYTVVDEYDVLGIKKEYHIIQVKLVNLKGVEKTYTSDQRFNTKKYMLDGTMDLLLDPEDDENYYIDFNIQEKHVNIQKEEKNEIKYNLNLFKDIKLKYFDRWLFFIISTIFLYGTIDLINSNKEERSILLFFALISIIIFYLGMKRTSEYYFAMKKVDRLLRNGVLIKDLEYELMDEETTEVDGCVDKVIAIKYKVNDNHEIILKSNPLGFKYDNLKDKVDLLIDVDDLLNFYIDFDIEEIKK